MIKSSTAVLAYTANACITFFTQAKTTSDLRHHFFYYFQNNVLLFYNNDIT